MGVQRSAAPPSQIRPSDGPEGLFRGSMNRSQLLPQADQLTLRLGRKFFHKRHKIPRKLVRQTPKKGRQHRLDLAGERPLLQLRLPGLGLVHLVEVVRIGARLRARCADDGLFVQFPRSLRKTGARYQVEQLHLVARPGVKEYYRAAGEILPLEGAHGYPR